MPANAQVTTSGYLDTVASTLIPRFRQQATDSTGSTVITNYSGPHWKVLTVVKREGGEPAYATAHIPLALTTNETAPTVAAVSGGPLDGIKIGTPAAVFDVYSGRENLVLAGYVTQITQDIKGDSATVVISDHLWMLKGIKLIGSFFLNGIVSVTYCSGVRAVFNPSGEPNCTYEPTYQIPVFCTPRYGLDDGETPPTSLPSAQGKAMYWTPQLIADYLQWVFTNPSAYSFATSSQNFFTQVPNEVTWPSGLSSALDAPDISINTIRKAREFDFEGWNIVAILQALADMSGHYALFVVPGSNYSADYGGTLSFQPTRYTGGGIPIGRSISGNANPNLNYAVFVGGTLQEDGTDLNTMSVTAGDTVYIETRVSTVSSGGFLWAHSSADFTAWKAIIASADRSTLDKAQKALDLANSTYPRAAAALLIDPNYDFQAGTSESGYPRAKRTRSILPHLFSSYAEGTGGTLQDRLNTARPVIFEYSLDSGSSWTVAREHDGFTVDLSDGTIWLTGLRGVCATLNNGGTAVDLNALTGLTSGQVNALTMVDIRATVVIPTDHRLLDAVRSSTDPTTNLETPPFLIDDADRIEKGFTRTLYTDAKDLYRYVYRYNSYAPPAAAGGAAAAGSVIDDTDYLRAHNARTGSDFLRLKKNGRITFPTLMSYLYPGQSILEIWNLDSTGNVASTVPVRAVVHEVVLHCEQGQNHTELILG